MDKRSSWLLTAGLCALCAAFTMAVRGPEHAVFLLLIAAMCYLRAQERKA